MPSVGLNTTSTNHIQPQASNLNPTAKAANQKTPGVLGKDDFLKLFLTSLQYQDPFNSMDMNQMMNQMSQMSLMEQVQNMTEAVNTLKDTMQTTALDGGMKFLGKEITGVTTEGEQISGKVEAIRLATNNQVQLVVNDKIVLVQFVTSVSESPIEQNGPTEPETPETPGK